MPDYFEMGFMVREPGWHKKGIILDDYPGREKGIILSGHNFEMVERPLYLPDEMINGEAVTYKIADGYKALIKQTIDPFQGMSAETRAELEGLAAMFDTTLSMPGDDTDGQLMHIASDTYGVVQNLVGWDIMDALVGEGVKYETAGVLKGGSICWILAYLDEPYTVPGDNSVILPYVNVSWSHDGSTAISARPTTIRVVCWNTQTAAEAEGERNSNSFTFRHSAKVMERIEDAKLAMSGIRGAHEEFIELAEELVKVPVTPDQREMFISQMIPMPPEALISDRVKTNIENDRMALRLLFSDENQSIPDAHKLTGYGLWLGGVEFLDHLRGYRSRDTLFGRQLMRNEPAKGKLRTLINEVAHA